MARIIIYKGGKGRGKTLTMVFEAYEYYLEGWAVYTNMQSCTFAKHMPPNEILDIDKNSKLNHCVLMIDELQTIMDARNSMSKQNKKFSYFLQQIRKRGIILLGTSQFSKLIDVRMRDQIDLTGFPNFRSEYDICECVYLDNSRFQDNNEFQEYKPTIRRIIFDAKPVYKLYDTDEIIV